jgi:hypothetical protein
MRPPKVVPSVGDNHLASQYGNDGRSVCAGGDRARGVGWRGEDTVAGLPCGAVFAAAIKSGLVSAQTGLLIDAFLDLAQCPHTRLRTDDSVPR